MSARDVRDILLAPRLERQVVRELLGPYGFADPEGADRNLQDVARDPQTRGRLAEVLPALLESLGRSADPDGALLRLERFLRASLSPGQVLSALQERPPAMDVLATTFGASPFMAEILIRNPAWFHWLSDPSVLGRARTSEEIEDDLDAALAPLQHRERQLDALRVAKRREILHVGARDLMRLAEVEETVTALSHLAEALIQKSYELAERWFREQRGLPPLAPEKARARGGFTVLGMGKLGGGELNFSSDVDLVFLGESDRGRLGRSGRAPSRIEHAEAVARNVTAALAEPTAEGTVYRVDLRLRPEGAAGGLVHSLSRFDEYYRSRGTTWERFALLRAWPVAGDVPLGLRFLKRVRPFVFGRPFGKEAVREVLRLKDGIDRKMAERGQSDRNVKLGIGGIREIEFVVQALQLKNPRLLERSTFAALEAIRREGALPAEQVAVLSRAYVFLRDVENKLQAAADTQVHSLPLSEDELRACALRVGYRDRPERTATQALMRDYRSHTEATHRVFRDVLREDRFPA